MKLYRENCRKATLDGDTIFIKDLLIFKNVPMEKIVIIDNSVLSFCYQFDNGIPILPFYKNKDDVELQDLVEYMKHLSTVDDIRIDNKEYICTLLNQYRKTHTDAEFNSNSSCSDVLCIEEILPNDSEKLYMNGYDDFETNNSVAYSCESSYRSLSKHMKWKSTLYNTNSEMSQSEMSDNKSSRSKGKGNRELFKCLEVFQKKYNKLYKDENKNKETEKK
jgi:hypothetical protein